MLDESEKQERVLGPTAIARHLSALRTVVDALPQRPFLMIGITPDALRRYSAALPALRGRLQNQITLEPLKDVDEATNLANFYLNAAGTGTLGRGCLAGAAVGSARRSSKRYGSGVGDRVGKGRCGEPTRWAAVGPMLGATLGRTRKKKKRGRPVLGQGLRLSPATIRRHESRPERSATRAIRSSPVAQSMIRSPTSASRSGSSIRASRAASRSDASTPNFRAA